MFTSSGGKWKGSTTTSMNTLSASSLVKRLTRNRTSSSPSSSSENREALVACVVPLPRPWEEPALDLGIFSGRSLKAQAPCTSQWRKWSTKGLVDRRGGRQKAEWGILPPPSHLFYGNRGETRELRHRYATRVPPPLQLSRFETWAQKSTRS